MIHAFVGMIDTDITGCIRGNGKTLGMSGYLFLKHLKKYDVYTNYYTDFSYMIDSSQNIINALREKYGNLEDETRLLSENVNAVVGFSEFKKVCDAIGSSQKQVKFVDLFASEIRKLDIDALYDTQRFKDINNRVRYHTDIIWIPEKRHADDLTLCNNDRCKRHHDIYLYRVQPYYKNWIRRFDAEVIGKHYDTRKLVIDNFEEKTNGNKS
jgi:hypothetical protein